MKQSALAAALILREMKGGRFYTLTRDCRSDGLKLWKKERKKENIKQNMVLFCFPVTAATWKIQTNLPECRRSHTFLYTSVLSPVTSSC